MAKSSKSKKKAKGLSLVIVDGWMVEGGGWAERKWGEKGDGHGSMIIVGGCRSVVGLSLVVGLRWL